MRELHLAAIALGSNLSSKFGTPSDNLSEAVSKIRELGTVTAVSSFHTTAPVGFLDQPDFVNAALLLETELRPLELLHRLLAIEQRMGRVRAGIPLKGPRIVDLDLIFYDELILDSPEVTLPHPAMHERAFVLEPLAEIAPEWRHPRLRATIRELLGRCPA